MFSLYVCGLASLEATTYSLYAVASHQTIFGLSFEEKDRRAATPKRIAQSFLKAAPDHPVTATLLEFAESSEYRSWATLRNTMTHRADIPRINRISFGGDLPLAKILQYGATWSHDALSGDEGAVRGLVGWVAASGERLFQAGYCVKRSRGRSSVELKLAGL